MTSRSGISTILPPAALRWLERLMPVRREEAESQARRIAALEERVRTFELLLKRVPDPLIIVDSGGTIVSSNDAAFSVVEGQPLGRALATVLRQPELLEAVDLLLAGRKEPINVEFEITGATRRQFLAHLTRVDLPTAPVVLIAMQELTALKRAERMRADFVANASHELRTPLATLVGFIETLQGPAKDDMEAHERFLGIMHEQGQRMTRLIRDLLSLSRIELHEHTRPSGVVDLRKVADSVAGMLEPLAVAKQMPIVVQGPGTEVEVLGDQDELTQVVQNLVDNAIKYGAAGTPVTVVVKPEGGMVGLSVHNHGEGIAREHLPRLTERFYRVDSARSRVLGGTGLGLAIVKHIVNRHRGAFSIESQERQGATFRITIPAAPAASRPARTDAA